MHYPPQENGLRVTSYDRAASLLIALLLLVGFFVSLLFIVWLTHRMVFSKTAAEIVLLEEPAGRGDHAEGYERDLEEPGLEELPELETPQLEAMLEAVTDVVSNQLAALDALQTNARQTGKGSGMGDSRAKGPGGDGDANVIPRWERWKINYSTKSIVQYAKQLDFFEIELGAVGGGFPMVDYAKNLSKGKPDTRKGRGKEEERVYFTQREGIVKQYDRQLLQRAGVRTQRRVVMQFYPPAVENQLAVLEKLGAEARGIMSLQQYKKTVFEVQAKGSNYEFVVVEQLFRPAPR